MEMVNLVNDKDMHIRIPKELKSESVLTLAIPKEMAGKTLKVVVEDNQDAPFERDAIRQNREKAVLRYFGEESYWEPEKVFRIAVKGNQNCNYGECYTGCQVASCAVHQGFASDEPIKIDYIRSDKVE